MDESEKMKARIPRAFLAERKRRKQCDICGGKLPNTPSSVFQYSTEYICSHCSAVNKRF